MERRIVPSKDFWSRDEFLAARKKQMEAHAKGETDCICKDPDSPFFGAEEIVMDPGDEIICDSCNANIDTPVITLVQFGRRAVCDECYKRWYKDEPLEYRELKADGSLGEIVQKIR